MKLNKLWASALALLALASCSKDLEPSANIIEPGQPAKTQLVHMDIKVTQDDNALRVGYGVSNGEDGALTGLAMVEKNVNLRIAVKQGLNGTPEIDTYPFNKVQGANLATFSGSIRIPVKSGNEPYYMAAVLESEGVKNTPDYVEYAGVTESIVSFDGNKKEPLQPDAQNKIYPNIPYRSQWTEVTMNAEGTVISRASIKLKPLGTLFRFRFHNASQTPQDVYEVYFNNPSFTRWGKIDLSAMDADGFPSWKPSGVVDLKYKLPTKITLPSGEYSDWYYIWIKSFNYTQSIRPQTLFVHYRNKDAVPYFETPIFKTKKPLRDGSVHATFRIRDGVDAELDGLEEGGDLETSDELYDWEGTVLRRLSPGVLNITESGFVSGYDVRDASVGYMTFSEALQKFKSPKPIKVGAKTKRYSLPTANEMKSIFPSRLLATSIPVAFNFGNRNRENILERQITINGETFDFRADFRTVASTKTTYAIRFKDDSANKHRTAFKYTLEEDNGNMFIRVKARLLGNTLVGMNDITQDSFWSNPSDYDERIFPFYGNKSHRMTNPQWNDYNKVGAFWTSTAISSEQAYTLFFTSNDQKYAHVDGKFIINDGVADEIPIFLFERK